MKQESGFNKTDHAIISDESQRQDRIGQTMAPDSLPPGESDNVSDVSKVCESDTGVDTEAGQASRCGKVKVIPLRQEDIDAGQISAGRNRMTIGFAVALSIVLGFIIIRSMGFSAGGQAKSPETEVPSAKKTGTVKPAGINWKIPHLIKSARDITRLEADSTELPDLPQLSGISISGIIVYNNNHRSAIIGNSIVKVGDVVGGVTVYKITEDSVGFEKDGVRWTRKVK